MWPLARARGQQDAHRLVELRAARRPSSSAGACSSNFDLTELAKYIDWGPFFQTWDLAGPVPGHPQGRDRRHRGRARLRRRPAHAQAPDRGAAGSARAAWSASGRPTPENDDDIVALRRRVAQREPRSPGTACASRPRSRRSRARCARAAARPTSSRRSESGLKDYVGMFAVTAGLGVAKKEKYFVDDLGRLLRHHAQGAGRPAGRGLRRVRMHHRVRADLWGYAADEALSNEADDRREVPRHPPRARLPGLPRPQREEADVRPPELHGHWHEPDAKASL